MGGEVELEIESLDLDGRGVAHRDGKAILRRRNSQLESQLDRRLDRPIQIRWKADSSFFAFAFAVAFIALMVD